MSIWTFTQNNRTIVLIILGVIVVCLLLPVLGFFACNALYPNPPRLEITYGEFPFRIEYEILGERFVIEDKDRPKYHGGIYHESRQSRLWAEQL